MAYEPIRLLVLSTLLVAAHSITQGQSLQDASKHLSRPSLKANEPQNESASAARSWLYGDDSGANDSSSTLFRIDKTGGLSFIGEIGIKDVTDIAILPDGRMYGITFTQLFKINIRKGTRSLIGDLGVNDANALASNKSGQLYAATISGKLGKVNKTTGRFTLIGFYGGGLGSTGDLAFSSSGALYGTGWSAFNSTDYLLRISKTTGQATVVGDTNFPLVFGLAFAPNGTLLAAARGDRASTPSLISIKTSTGIGKQIKQLTGANGMFGLASNMKLSSVIGSFRVTGVENTVCDNVESKWTFCQHQTGFHRPGGGIKGSDDTYAWDLNLANNLDKNEPVYAVAPGTVVEYAGTVSPGSSSGAVLIEHSQGGVLWWSGYLHLHQINVIAGQQVDKNTVLGLIGNAGATNDHLHLVFYEGSNEPGKLISFDAGFFKQ